MNMSLAITHFADDQWSHRTLCGINWTGIVMNDRPATCKVCSDLHHGAGWTFPLPPVVTS